MRCPLRGPQVTLPDPFEGQLTRLAFNVKCFAQDSAVPTARHIPCSSRGRLIYKVTNFVGILIHLLKHLLRASHSNYHADSPTKGFQENDMLVTKIISPLALVAGTFAIPQQPSTTNTSSLAVNRSPIITSGYSAQEREQIQQAHLDAVKLVRTAIGSVAQDQYDRILVKYFDVKDHQLVWSK
jgi:hypothetical protein